MSEPATPPCPICGRPPEARFRPFCSPRCADVDLGRWFSDVYAIPAAPDDDEDAEPWPGPDRAVPGHDGTG